MIYTSAYFSVLVFAFESVYNAFALALALAFAFAFACAFAFFSQVRTSLRILNAP